MLSQRDNGMAHDLKVTEAQLMEVVAWQPACNPDRQGGASPGGFSQGSSCVVCMEALKWGITVFNSPEIAGLGSLRMAGIW